MKPERSLKELRKIYGLSQADIAEAIGAKSRGTIIAIENGERSLTAEELEKLADFLGVEVAELIDFEIPDYDKYREMLVETLRRYMKYTGHPAPKTLFAKLIYLEDFAWFYQELKPMSGMKYRRDPFGPVPDQFFRVVDEMIERGEMRLEVKTLPNRKKQMQSLSLSENTYYEPSQYLSDREIEVIDQVVKKWQKANTDQIVDFTHKQLPWQATRPNEFIPYELITQEEPDNVF